MADMHLNRRQSEILAQLKLAEYLEIEALATSFNVTTQTIRRDINQLCDIGLARRHHGGVGLPSALSNANYELRVVKHSDSKSVIADEVASRIPDGATVTLGIGTTISAIAQRLLPRSELRVVTNNLQVASILGQNQDIDVWLAGGKLRANDQDIVGNSVIEFIRRFNSDIAIIGCAGISNDGWATEFSPEEADISTCILASGQQKWLVADESKWQRNASVKVARTSSFDLLFTNKDERDSGLPLVYCQASDIEQ